MLKNLLLITLLSFFSLGLNAQRNLEFSRENFPEDPKGLNLALDAIKRGDRALQNSPPNYALALTYFHEAHAFNGNNASLNFKIGKCYLNLAEKYRALPYLNQAGKLNPHLGNQLTFALAEANLYALNYKQAEKLYLEFQAAFNGNNADTLALISKRLAACRLGQQFLAQPANHKILNMGERINSSFDEYVPLITADEYMLVFTTKRPHRKQRRINPYNHDYYESIYVAFYRNAQWTQPLRLSKPINRKRDNTASVHLTFDGQIMFFYSSRNNGDILYSELNGDKWGKPMPFTAINTKEYTESHVSLSYDGNTAYFVSNRPGGFGGSDIWVVYKDDEGNWGNPRNLGPEINTPGNEDAPFIHPDNKTMYFSSDGHPGIGGFDIFETERMGDTAWKAPRNLRYPINGPDDDLFFILSADGMNAYFSSSRPGGFGGQDLYVIRPFNPDFPEDTIPFKEFDVTLFVGFLVDAETRKPVGGRVEIVDNSSGEAIWANQVNASTGKFTLTLPTGKNYGIAVEADGYMFYSENFNMEKQVGFREVHKEIRLNKVTEGASLVLNNVFFSFNKWELLPESKAELARALNLLNRYPKYRVTIEGHTDNIGPDEANDRISQARAEAVRDYLIANGFPAMRIISVTGFGKRKPITDNETPEGRAKNRRVEIRLER